MTTSPVERPARRWGLFAVVALTNATILWGFHDRYWYPSDEGIYAHIAERLLAGEVLSRDVQSVHPGYINFLNAGAMWLFGLDLLSLRYPLMAAAFLQGCLVFDLLARRSLVIAAAASFIITALGTIQFLNPTANWYCLTLVVAVIWWMQVVPRQHRWRLVGAGFLVGLILLFRQISGLWAGMALLVVVCFEESRPTGESRAWLARGLLAGVALLLMAYLVTAEGSRPLAKLMMGLWPVVVAVIAVARVSVPNRAACSAVVRLSCGMAAAALPLIVYLAVHRTFLTWLDDTVFSAMQLAGLDFMKTAVWSSHTSLLGLLQMLQPRDLPAFINGFYWLCVSAAPMLNGALTVNRLRHGGGADLLLPIMAVFYTLVSVLLDGSMYWYLSAGLSLVGCLWYVTPSRAPWQWLTAAVALTLGVTGVYFHAGQSSLRSGNDKRMGHRSWTASTPICTDIPRATLRIEQRDCEPYRRVVEILRSEVPPDATIFAIPNDAEFYFLANRPSPFRFYNTALGIRHDDDLSEVLAALAADPPFAVTFRPADKYNTAASVRIMEYVRSTYQNVQTIGDVEIYQLPGVTPP